MIAVIMTGGKQYKVKEGDVIDVEKIAVETGRVFEFSKVLLIADEAKVMVGTPFISNAGVRAEVVEHRKGDKVLIFKKKRRKQYRRFKGHRQQLARVRITDIIPDLSQAPVKKAAPPAERPVEKPAPSPKPSAPAARPAEEKHKAAEKHAPVKAAKPAPKAAKPAKAEKPKAEHKKAAKPAPRPKKSK